LKTLSEIGLLQRLDSVGEGCRYELSTHHHHHLVCLKCHDTVAIDFCPMTKHINKLAEESGFLIADHNFEIKGFCTKCREDDN
jgi:Fe2+ or Zn2+ uptake regulation protein